MCEVALRLLLLGLTSHICCFGVSSGGKTPYIASRNTVINIKLTGSHSCWYWDTGVIFSCLFFSFLSGLAMLANDVVVAWSNGPDLPVSWGPYLPTYFAYIFLQISLLLITIYLHFLCTILMFHWISYHHFSSLSSSLLYTILILHQISYHHLTMSCALCSSCCISNVYYISNHNKI